jgi:hypothetical protein
MKNHNSNYHRLTVYLANLEHKKDFQTTYTYKNKLNETQITSVQDAINVVRTLHSLSTDTATDIIRKIRKVVFNGKEIPIFTTIGQHTNNGWIVK